jgi:guanylate kinase
MKKQKIFIFSGPGGAGKTTVVNELFKDEEIAARCMKAVAVTSRQKREQEVEGKDYFFVTKEEFAYLKARHFFLESEKVVDNYYGTPKLFQPIAARFKRDLVLCIDVKGGMNLKKKIKNSKIITIFVTAASEATLLKRMKKRCDEPRIIAARGELAKKELQFSKYYDYVIVNKALKTAVKAAKEIILAHH